MPLAACGAAFVDRSGAIVAADPGFLVLLGLPKDDPSGSLRALARAEPAIAALLSGEGPAIASLPRPGRAPLDLERVASREGFLLLLRDSEGLETQEHAMRSRALDAVAPGLVHDIRNPLNAIALQVALLGEKLSRFPEVDAPRHLGTVREQVNRVDEVVRRLSDALDPPTPGVADLGALVADSAALLGHAARCRGIALVASAPPRIAFTRCAPGRVGRLVVGVLARVLEETPDRGALAARVEVDGDRAVLLVERTAGEPAGDLGHVLAVASASAADLGGEVSLRREGGAVRLRLALPGRASP